MIHLLQNRRFGSRIVVLVFLMAAGAGCSGSRVVPVTGKVRYRGEPLAKATVTFIPIADDSGKGALGVCFTDDDGKFTLQTRLGSADKMGTMPGNYRVAISKFVPPPGVSEADYQKMLDNQQTMHRKGMVPLSPVPSKQELIPAEFSDTRGSKLTATVKLDGKNEFSFEIP